MSELPSWGSVGVWLSKLSLVGAAEAVSVARCIEECGYGSLWIGETTTGKEVLTHAGLLLAGTEQLVIGTGIASVWARDAVAAHAGAVTLGEAYPGRFVLGLSVSHRQLAEVRGHRYDRPLAAMRGYLDEMAAARCDAPAGPVPVPVVLAALGPKMTTLAIERTTGVHTYFMPVDHTRRSRQLMGATSALLPEQAFVVDANPVRARSIAREHMAFYWGSQTIYGRWRISASGRGTWLGGANRLVDALVAWGEPDHVAQRITEQLNAGADHVLVQPLGEVANAVDQLMAVADRLRPHIITA